MLPALLENGWALDPFGGCMEIVVSAGSSGRLHVISSSVDRTFRFAEVDKLSYVASDLIAKLGRKTADTPSSRPASAMRRQHAMSSMSINPGNLFTSPGKWQVGVLVLRMRRRRKP